MKTKTPRIIFNNDGCDGRMPMDDFDDPMEFLDVRTTPLVGTHVDVISFCSNSGFGLFKHESKHGSTVPLLPNGIGGVFHALKERGTDPLAETVKFGHANGMDVYCAFRMNDVHDGGEKNRWMFEANKFKNENPDCLMGVRGENPMCGKWLTVDYAKEKVRDVAIAFVEEVCQNYDVDGIELDFFRHPVFFRTTSAGEPVTEEQREIMTNFMRRLSAMIKSEGEKRGRPFVVVARTPDDVDYAATIGLDLECWMREKLIDIFVPSAYFRQRSWRDSVELGHRHDVKVYAGFSESRVGGGHHANVLRASDECYRARAANAWREGVDGIYMFNLFDPHRRVWSELGDPETLKRLDKLYFASVRGIRMVAGGGAYPYRPFVTIPTLNPEAPAPLGANGHQVVRIAMDEDVSDLPKDKIPTITLSLKISDGTPNGDAVDVQPDALTVVFNGHALTNAEIGDGWLQFPLNPTWPRRGQNTVEAILSSERDGLFLADVMVGVDHSGNLLSDTSYHERTRKKM